MGRPGRSLLFLATMFLATMFLATMFLAVLFVAGMTTPRSGFALAAAPADVAYHPNDGTLPHPRVSLCHAGDRGCVGIRVRPWRGAPFIRYQPRFSGSIARLGPTLMAAMTGVSWRPGCPVGLGQLRVLSLRHWRPDGTWTTGQLIVGAKVAPAVLKAFQTYFRARFPITSLIPVHHFGGSDERSMQVDNTSAFNCRRMTGGRRWSEHAYGTAIDINPFRNPYVRRSLVLPAAAKAWAKRGRVRPGMLVPTGPGVQVWRSLGWGWGGAWRRLQDYQHVSLRDR